MAAGSAADPALSAVTAETAETAVGSARWLGPGNATRGDARADAAKAGAIEGAPLNILFQRSVLAKELDARLKIVRHSGQGIERHRDRRNMACLEQLDLGLAPAFAWLGRIAEILDEGELHDIVGPGQVIEVVDEDDRRIERRGDDFRTRRFGLPVRLRLLVRPPLTTRLCFPIRFFHCRPPRRDFHGCFTTPLPYCAGSIPRFFSPRPARPPRNARLPLEPFH